jgi:hypothetical protein
MPAAPDSNLPLRLALSHREKTVAMLSEIDAAFSRGGLDESQFLARQKLCRQEQSLANAAIDRLRKRAQAHAETLRVELSTCRHEQAHLPDHVSAGKISPQLANNRNRELTERIGALRAELREVDARAMAESAEDLGGFVDLPLEEYPRRIQAASGSMPGEVAAEVSYPKRWELATVLVAGCVCVLAVFLPWVIRGGEVESLFRVGLDLSTDGANPFARLAWVAYVLIPWLGVVVLLRIRGIALGWSLLGVGLLMLAGALLPVALAGADRVHSEDLRQLWGALHSGPILYAIGAILLIVVGALRVSPWDDSLVHALTTSLVLVGTVAAVAGIAALFLFFGPQPGSVRFEVTRYEDSVDVVRVICRNGSRDTIRLAIPWPDDGADSFDSGETPDFGAQLEARESHTGAFRALPYSQEPWELLDSPSLEIPVVEVRPGSHLELRLDLKEISVMGADAEAIQLTFTRRNGTAVSRYEIPLPSRYLSPAAEARNPLDVPKPVTSEGVAENPTLPAPIEDSEPEPMPQIVSRGGFAFTGIVGGKAAIEAWDASGVSTGSRLIQSGDAIGEGWYLESLSASPAAIVVHHDPTGTQAVVSRGERMSF